MTTVALDDDLPLDQHVSFCDWFNCVSVPVSVGDGVVESPQEPEDGPQMR